MSFLKRLFCKHKEKVCITNIYGAVILDYNCRSIWKCKNCGKMFKSDELEESCDVVNFDMKR